MPLDPYRWTTRKVLGYAEANSRAISQVPSRERASTRTTSKGGSWIRRLSKRRRRCRASFFTVTTTVMKGGSAPSSLANVHHDDVLDRPHALEREHEPSGAVDVEEPGYDVLARGDEHMGDPAGLGVDHEVLDHTEDLAVIGHYGLSPELSEELSHGMP